MRYLLVLLLSIVILSSCETLEQNSPAFQGSLDNVLFKADDARAFLQPDGSVIIKGVRGQQTLTLKIRMLQTGNYNLGVNDRNIATFEDVPGNLYTTDPNGDGVISVSNIDIGTITGTFRFNAILLGIDTLNLQNGVFYQVPYEIDSGTDTTSIYINNWPRG